MFVEAPLLKKCCSSVGSPTCVFVNPVKEIDDVDRFLELFIRKERVCSGWEVYCSASGYSRKNRAILIDWMSEFCCEHHFQRQTFHLACNILDLFLSCSYGSMICHSKLQLVGLTALLISIKNMV